MADTAGKRTGRAWIPVTLLAIVTSLRFYLAVASPESYEIRFFWRDIAERVSAGAQLYAHTAYHFPPLWAWLLSGFHRLSQAGVPFAPMIRCFLVIVDLCSAGLVFHLARSRRGGAAPWTAALLFLANPLGIWVSCYQGQFDNLSILFLLAAVVVSRRGQEEAGAGLAGLWLFLSIAAKQVSAFHPLLWLRRRGGTAAAGIAYLGTAVLLLPYAKQWRAMAVHFFTYTAVPRSYGFSEWVLYDFRWGRLVGAVGALAALAMAWWAARLPLVRGCLLIFLVILFFAPGVGTQYLIWPLAFGALAPGAGYFLFTASSTLWALGSHFGIPGSGRWMGHLVWLCVWLWLIWEIREARREATVPSRQSAAEAPGPTSRRNGEPPALHAEPSQ